MVGAVVVQMGVGHIDGWWEIIMCDRGIGG